jgi:hypothetical protein
VYDHAHDNRKIFLGTFSCTVALLLHFFPELLHCSKSLTFPILFAYLTLSITLQLYSVYAQMGARMIKYDLTAGHSYTSDKSAWLSFQCKSQKNKEDVTVALTQHGQRAASIQRELHLCNYLYEDGIFADKKLGGEVRHLLQELRLR